MTGRDARVRLLLAEDDAALAALLDEYLTEAGYAVTTCRRGDEALQRLRESAFDLILSDIVMPGADGLTLLREASGDPTRTLVILMTGYSGIEDALHAVEQGAYDFVSKPFQLPEILVRLNNAARYQALLRRLRSLEREDKTLPLPPAVESNGRAALRAYGGQ
ncbi:MAG: response regulator [Mariprofundaceae bacterium]